MFRVKLSHIPEDGCLEEKGIKIPLSELGLTEPFSGTSVSLDYRFQRVQDKVLGNFHGEASARLECSRCAETFDAGLAGDFMLDFEKKPEQVNPRSGIDLEDPELNVVFFEGDDLPLTDEIRQEMELCLPFKPLCKPDCLGLCQVCGGNKNLKACDCEQGPKNNPFADLKKLF